MKRLIIGLGLFGLIAGAGAAQARTIINPGTPDAAVMVYVPAIHRIYPIQLEYLDLVNRPDIVVFEDGSIVTRARFERMRHAHDLRALKPTGSSFIPTGIESTEDR